MTAEWRGDEVEAEAWWRSWVDRPGDLAVLHLVDFIRSARRAGTTAGARLDGCAEDKNMHATRATRPRNLDRNSVIHFARFANKGGLVCEPERSFDALWDDERHSDIYQSGSGNEETNFRFSRTPEHVTCPDCLEILSERTGTPAPKNAARIAAVLTDYHHGSDRPYRALLHDPATDRQLDKHELIEKLAAQAGAVDGDEIEIQIRKTGARPFGNEKVRLVAPHTYCRGPASEEHR